MELINQLIKELEELKSVKQENEYLKADKQRMSDKLYELMMREYSQTDYEEREQLYINKECKYCRYGACCDLQGNLPKDILKPIKSEKGWIPGKKICNKFEWN